MEMRRAGAPATAGCPAALLPAPCSAGRASLSDVCPGEEPTAPCISSGVLLVLTITLFLALMLGISRENNRNRERSDAVEGREANSFSIRTEMERFGGLLRTQ